MTLHTINNLMHTLKQITMSVSCLYLKNLSIGPTWWMFGQAMRHTIHGFWGIGEIMNGIQAATPSRPWHVIISVVWVIAIIVLVWWNLWTNNANCGTFYEHGLTLIPAWISNHMIGNVWGPIAYPFLNFNGCTVEVKEWISNFIPHFIMDEITYPCWDVS